MNSRFEEVLAIASEFSVANYRKLKEPTSTFAFNIDIEDQLVPSSLDMGQHISPPSSPPCDNPYLQVKHTKHGCSSKAKPKLLNLRDEDKEDLIISQTPSISPSPSPVRSNTKNIAKLVYTKHAYSASTKKQQLHIATKHRKTKRELFQDITILVSPNKQSRLNTNNSAGFSPVKNYTNNVVLDVTCRSPRQATISPCNSPSQLLYQNVVEKLHSPRLFHTNISPCKSPSQRLSQNVEQEPHSPRYVQATISPCKSPSQHLNRNMIQQPHVPRYVKATISPCKSPSQRLNRNMIQEHSPRPIHATISPCRSPSQYLNRNKIQHHHHSPRSVHANISPCKSPSQHLNRNTDQRQDIGEVKTPAKKENRGTDWLNGIAWKPVTPAKSSSSVVLPDSAKKKKRYHVSGGLAQRLQKLESREQSELNLFRYQTGVKHSNLSEMKVKEVNFSSPALPVALCQETTTVQDALVVIPLDQVSRVCTGSMLKFPFLYHQLHKDMSRLALLCPRSDLQVLEQHVVSLNPTRHVLFKWQCPCRISIHMDPTMCPSNL